MGGRLERIHEDLPPPSLEHEPAFEIHLHDEAAEPDEVPCAEDGACAELALAGVVRGRAVMHGSERGGDDDDESLGVGQSRNLLEDVQAMR